MEGGDTFTWEIIPTGIEDGCGPVSWQKQRPQKLNGKILT